MKSKANQYVANFLAPVQFISVNNGVLVCAQCAEEHRKLPSGISYIMGIADVGEIYSQHKTELLKFGGNERFVHFLESYRDEETGECVFKDWPIKEKYQTNACKYYRHKIQQLAKQETPQMEAPDLLEAKIIMEEDIEGKDSKEISNTSGLDWAIVTDEDRIFAAEQSELRNPF